MSFLCHGLPLQWPCLQSTRQYLKPSPILIHGMNCVQYISSACPIVFPSNSFLISQGKNYNDFKTRSRDKSTASFSTDLTGLKTRDLTRLITIRRDATSMSHPKLYIIQQYSLEKSVFELPRGGADVHLESTFV